MDEIAPEYDVVVLGTGTLEFLNRHHKTGLVNHLTYRPHGMCAFWVKILAKHPLT